jgi:GTP pyrophosphokinase
MKTHQPVAAQAAVPSLEHSGDTLATEASRDIEQQARAFAEPLLAARELGTGELALDHADAMAEILRGIGASPALRAASWLVYSAEHLGKPEEVLTRAFDASLARLVVNTRKLMQLQRAALAARARSGDGPQTELVRKMLLAFSRDLRVVLLRFASRLQTLRFLFAQKLPCPRTLALETLQVLAPLANRLGIWQIKWELEDLSFRALEPEQYHEIARLLDAKRAEREQRVEALRRRLGEDLVRHGIAAVVQGRPKHIYSIWKKMRGKGLPFADVMDVRALRVIVADVPACYAALGRVHEIFRPLADEFDDYIARPKPNGYQSLHTVVLDEQGLAVEVQIRTQAMHEHAEHGVSAHWAYKEAGFKASVQASGDFEARVAEARLTVLRQLLAWEREVGREADLQPDEGEPAGTQAKAVFDDRIYVFTPQAAVVELPAGATPIDFAYTLHTELGHRCRGAKVDGAIVPLNTPLQNGQTVEVTAIKAGGPSLDWLNPELGYLQSPRARAKVRAWFNALAQQATIARGREAVEKLLQRESKTAVKLDDLATRLGFKTADALFEVVGRDELSLRSIETLLRPAPEAPPAHDEPVTLRRTRPQAVGGGGVLVVGVGSLLTLLARCCRPVPPDAIVGYVTRGKGVAVHRAGCSNFRELAARAPERVINVAWGTPRGEAKLYPVDISVEAVNRPGLLRDISEVLAKEKINVSAVGTQTPRHANGASRLSVTVEVADSTRLAAVLPSVARVSGVRSVRRA